MTPSDTPETEAYYATILAGTCMPDCDSYGHNDRCTFANGEACLADFAANLERQRNEAREELAKLRSGPKHVHEWLTMDAWPAGTVRCIHCGLYSREQYDDGANRIDVDSLTDDELLRAAMAYGRAGIIRSTPQDCMRAALRAMFK